MKIILYMAMTANGCIARQNNETDFVSEVEWRSFKKMANQVGTIIMGRKTYDIMFKAEAFSGMGAVKIVILSRKKTNVKKNVDTYSSVQSALQGLKKKGIKKVLLAGGSLTNASFMKENFVDEVYLDIEPILLGKGIPLFDSSVFEMHMRLKGIKQLSKDEVQLHYVRK
jgi:dihydrofolate reductase